MKVIYTHFFSLFAYTGRAWLEDKAPRLGAALAFYSALSIGPLLLLALSFGGLVFGQEAARGHLVEQINGLVGEQGAEAIQLVLANAREPEEGFIATAVGLVMLLIGASGVFGELQEALNTIWRVKTIPGRGVMRQLRERFLSFSMILGTGFLLLISLVITTLLAAFDEYLTYYFPALHVVMIVGNQFISFGLITTLFALIFKYLPDTRVYWSDVWIGALLTSLLFAIGKYFIGLYLGHSTIGSTYGATGSVIVLLVWIYYSAQILYFGAEFTRVYAEEVGSKRHSSNKEVTNSKK